jgi:hypothetical protein
MPVPNDETGTKLKLFVLVQMGDIYKKFVEIRSFEFAYICVF